MGENVAIPLTKPLPQPKHDSHAKVLGIRRNEKCL